MLTPKFELIRTSDNSFRLINNNISTTESLNIFGMFTPNESKSEFIISSKSQITDFSFHTRGLRPYFLIEYSIHKKKFIIAERTLNISGMNNFRDMGGYETISGQTIKWGNLYRGDHLFNADENGLKSLIRLGINTIIDYRSNSEISKYPNKLLGKNTKVYNFDPSAHAAELAAQFNSSKENEDINLINKLIENKKRGILYNQSEVVLTQYKAFVNKTESKKAFSNMLKVAMNQSSLPVFQHCRGGKDRTGFGAMLILGILGVDKNTIIYDYLITAKNREKRNEHKMNKYRELTNDQEILDHLYSFIAADSRFLEGSINEICTQYQNIENYVIQELGVTHGQICSFKERLLQNL